MHELVIIETTLFLFCVTGKWHLGTRPGHHPLDKGFHSYLGVPYSVDMGCADPPGSNLPPCAACPEGKVVQKLNEIAGIEMHFIYKTKINISLLLLLTCI